MKTKKGIVALILFISCLLLVSIGYGPSLNLSHGVGKTKMNQEKIDFIGDSLIYWGKWTELFPDHGDVRGSCV